MNTKPWIRLCKCLRCDSSCMHVIIKDRSGKHIIVCHHSTRRDTHVTYVWYPSQEGKRPNLKFKGTFKPNNSHFLYSMYKKHVTFSCDSTNMKVRAGKSVYYEKLVLLFSDRCLNQSIGLLNFFLQFSLFSLDEWVCTLIGSVDGKKHDCEKVSNSFLELYYVFIKVPYFLTKSWLQPFSKPAKQF